MQALRAVVFAVLAPVLTAVGFTLASLALLLDPGRGRASHAVASVGEAVSVPHPARAAGDGVSTREEPVRVIVDDVPRAE
jgi:hypothetical protein